MELLDAVERLGVEALLASAERAGDLADVEDELFRFGQIVAGDPALAAALGDPTVPAARRAAELVEDLLAGKVADGHAAAGPSWRWPASAAAASPPSLTRLVELAAAPARPPGGLRHGRGAARPTRRSSGWAPRLSRACTVERSP